MKKIISLVLAFTLVFSTSALSFADSIEKSNAIDKEAIRLLAQIINAEKNPDGSYSFDRLNTTVLSEKTKLDTVYVKNVIEALREADKLVNDKKFVEQIRTRKIASYDGHMPDLLPAATYPSYSTASIYVSMNGGRQRYSFVTHDDMEESYEYTDDLTLLTAFILAAVRSITGTMAGGVAAAIYSYQRYYEELDESGGDNGVVFLKDYDAGPGGLFDWAWDTYPYLNY